MSWARLSLFLWNSTAEHRRLRLASDELGLGLFDYKISREMIQRKPTATTAFILGTGASAAQLSDAKLAHISEQFSIGVNQWVAHPLVPDVYAYESHRDNRLLEVLDRPEVREKCPYLLFLRPKAGEAGAPSLAHLPDFMRAKSFLYGRINLVTRRRANIARDVIAVARVSSILRRREVVIDNGASIARLLYLCVLMGFREIVLVGVDLNSVEYFWQRNPELIAALKSPKLSTEQTGLSHETLSTTNRPFSIIHFIDQLSRDKRFKPRIFIESQNSALFGILEHYQFG